MEQAPGRVNLVPCKVCGRTFNEDVLPRHMPICQKNAKKKRKVFDSGKQRAAGSDVPYNSTIKPGQAPKADAAKYQKAHEATRNNWKYKHEQFIQGMRAARGAPPLKGSSSTGGAVGGGGGPSMDACRYCGRTFNPDRIEKHEQICGAQAKRAQKDVANKGRGAPVGARGGAGRGASGGGATSNNRPSPASGPAAAAGSRLGGAQRSPLNHSSTNSPVTRRTNTVPRTVAASAAGVASGGSSPSRSTRGQPPPPHSAAASPATAVRAAAAAGGSRTTGGSISKIPSGPARTHAANTSVNNTGDHSHDYERVGAPPLVKQRRPRESSVRSAYAELPLSPSSPGGQPFCCGIPSRSKSKSNRPQQHRNSGQPPQYANVPATAGGGNAMAKFCGGCGTKFSGTTAKFCYECGAPRGR